MDKALSYLALARKAGLAELGEEPVGAAARAVHAHLILVAKDASEHTWRRAQSFAAGTNQQCLRLPCSKDEMGAAIGRSELAIAAVTDPALALALVQSLDDAGKHQQTLDYLQHLTDRNRRLAKEAKAHQRNRRFGKKHSSKNP